MLQCGEFNDNNDMYHVILLFIAKKSMHRDVLRITFEHYKREHDKKLVT